MRSQSVAAILSVAALVIVVSIETAADSESMLVDTSFTAASGERVLEQSIVVPAPVEEVWQAFTTSRGFSSWAVPLAMIDFRLGGIMETSYDPTATSGDPKNIKNEIVAYLPYRMLAFRNIQAPPDTKFDAPTFQKLHTVVLFTKLSPTETEVTTAQPGYGDDARFDQIYNFFRAGNGWTLEKLRQRFEDGPIDWQRELSSSAKE